MNESYQDKQKPQNTGNNPNAIFSPTPAKPAAQKPAADESTSLLSNKKSVTNNAADINDRPWYRKFF